MSKANRRFHRTLFLGLVALGVMIWAAINRFGLSAREMFDSFLGVLSIVLVMIVLAALCVGIWVTLRNWLRGRDEEP